MLGHIKITISILGVLSHHLGWVETVMPSSLSGFGDNSLNKPDSEAVEQFSQLHWYSPTRVQYKVSTIVIQIEIFLSFHLGDAWYG